MTEGQPSQTHHPSSFPRKRGIVDDRRTTQLNKRHHAPRLLAYRLPARLAAQRHPLRRRNRTSWPASTTTAKASCRASPANTPSNASSGSNSTRRWSQQSRVEPHLEAGTDRRQQSRMARLRRRFRLRSAKLIFALGSRFRGNDEASTPPPPTRHPRLDGDPAFLQNGSTSGLGGSGRSRCHDRDPARGSLCVRFERVLIIG